MKRKLSWAAALSIVIALASVGLASADVVYNDITDGIDDTPEVVELEVGQSTDVVLELQNTNAQNSGYPDTQNACNSRGSNSLVLDIINSNPGAVTLSASQITFLDCAETVTLTVTGVGAGTAEIRFAVSASSTADGVNDVAPADFDVVVTGGDPGREASAVANAFLKGADADQVAACRAANGTNRNQANWHGQLISKVSAEFGDQTFTTGQEQIVVDFVLGLCA